MDRKKMASQENRTVSSCALAWVATIAVFSAALASPAFAAQTDITISTAAAPATPRILGAAVVGAVPGSPLLYTVSATGQAPLKFEFEIRFLLFEIALPFQEFQLFLLRLFQLAVAILKLGVQIGHAAGKFIFGIFPRLFDEFTLGLIEVSGVFLFLQFKRFLKLTFLFRLRLLELPAQLFFDVVRECFGKRDLFPAFGAGDHLVGHGSGCSIRD